MLLTKENHITKKIWDVLDSLPKNQVVLDLGTAHRFCKEIRIFRNFLEKNHYYALGYNADRSYGDLNCDIDGDIEALPFKDNSADVVFCIEVIEHVAHPYDAVQEMYRVLKPGGLMILTTPFLTPFHGRGNDLSDFSHGGYPDFWRFSHHGLLQLSQDFSETEVVPFIGTLSYFRTTLFGGNGQFLDSYFDKLVPPKIGGPTNRHLLVAYK